jgi:hypothetical protein
VGLDPLISFRFHIVSLAAVFMALALGIVMGTAFLNEATVNNLEGRIRSVRADVDNARQELSVLRDFTNEAENALVEDRLPGVRVLMVVPEGLDGSVTDKMRTVLATAGAIDAGTLTIDKAWAEETPPTDEIATALGIVGPSSITSITDAAAERLAGEFADGGGSTLPSLVEANLMRLDAGDPASTPGGPVRYLVIDNGAPAGLLEPLTRALAARSPNAVLVADAGPDDAVGDSLVGVLRGDPQRAQFSTVDHVRTPPGRVAAILALRDFARGVTGDYGSGPGADRASPAAVAPAGG